MTEDEYQLEDVYEAVFGTYGIDRYSHTELIDRLHEMYECYVKENANE